MNPLTCEVKSIGGFVYSDEVVEVCNIIIDALAEKYGEKFNRKNLVIILLYLTSTLAKSITDIKMMQEVLESLFELNKTLEALGESKE
jgi:transcriptional regulatory protein LevR